MTSTPRSWLYPVAVWLALLAILFATEWAVMLALSWVIPENANRVLDTTLDALILTLLLAPLLWLTIVRPLREVIRLRTQFLADLFVRIETERKHTAYELHDGVGQPLTLLISGLRSAAACRRTGECSERVDHFQRLAEDALAEIRRVSRGLRPSLLDDLGLAPALERLADDLRASQPVAVALDLREIVGKKFPEPVGVAVFRIVQEALSNVARHSGARHAAVSVRHSDGRILVEVKDDGCGIEPPRLRALGGDHLGLRGMRERAGLLGGSAAVDSAPGRGTRLTVTLPAGGA